MYQYFEGNPSLKIIKRGKKKGKVVHKNDCVIRAFQVLWNVDWKEAATRLFNRALELYDLPNSQDSYTTFLRRSNKYQSYETNYSHKRYKTVSEIARETLNDTKAYLCHTTGHVVAISNGNYYDCWDSGKSKVHSIWELR